MGQNEEDWKDNPAYKRHLAKEAAQAILPLSKAEAFFQRNPKDLFDVLIKERGFVPKSQPNKTETEYGNRLALEFRGAVIKFEGLTLKLDNGMKYTPDWVVRETLTGQIILVEVKNAAYKHASYGRSKMAFAQCQIDWPMFGYRWAEKTKDGWITK